MQLPNPVRPLAFARPSRDWGDEAALAPPANMAADAKPSHSRREMPPIPVSNPAQGVIFVFSPIFVTVTISRLTAQRGSDHKRAQRLFRHPLAHHRPDHAGRDGEFP